MARENGFDLHGEKEPASPVVLSVPHAGREYPLALRAALRVPLAYAVSLEDRHADTLALAARGTETLLVQGRARAWIDLNRAEHERDPRLDDGAGATVQPTCPSTSTRSVTVAEDDMRITSPLMSRSTTAVGSTSNSAS